jgi:ankyrin repeat protein
VIAAGSADVGVMKLLLASGADPLARTPDGATAIMVATGGSPTATRVTETDRVETIRLALAAGVDIEAEDRKGYRAMHMAASSELHKIIRFLLAQGADLNPVTRSRMEAEVERGEPRFIAGQTPLGIAEGSFLAGSYIEKPETAEFLRNLGAKSVGRVTLESYMKALKDKPNAQDPPQ